MGDCENEHRYSSAFSVRSRNEPYIKRRWPSVFGLGSGLPSHLSLGEAPCPSSLSHGFLHYTIGTLDNATCVHSITNLGMHPHDSSVTLWHNGGQFWVWIILPSACWQEGALWTDLFWEMGVSFDVSSATPASDVCLFV
jgi:hypothetical protein